MIFKDNVLKEYLKNVYFITGTPCGGKTTISRELGRRHGFLVYDVDEQFSAHRKMSSPFYQPAMNKMFKNADEFFGRTTEEYAKWLLENTREQLDYVLMDLIRISQDQTIICDLHLTVDEAEQLTDYARIVFLIKEPSNLIDDYCNRPDHSDFSDYVNSATQPESAKENCNRTLEYLNRGRYECIKKSRFFWIERDSHSTKEGTMLKVEQHFGLQKR